MATRHTRTVIEEVSGVDSPYLPGMGSWLLELFPEYAPPRFKALLTRLRHQHGRHEAQIFVGLIDDEVAGLVQVLYRQAWNGLIADIDLLGVLEPRRRAGLGTALVERAIRATKELSGYYGLPPIGVVSLVDPENTPVIRLHERLGGQVRTDLQVPSGELIVWYPLMVEYAAVETEDLAKQLQEFGRLLRYTFSEAKETWISRERSGHDDE
jgi:GNAT superfamily N-acetyltransferase